MCFAFLTDSVMHTITCSGDLTALPSHIASVRLTDPVPVLIVGMFTLAGFAETRFPRIRRHSFCPLRVLL